MHVSKGIATSLESGMGIIGKVPVNVFIHAAALDILVTILLCYTLAVSLGHVPVWLPMISDCAVYPPEKYPFRWGFVVGATLMGAQNVLIFGADKPYSRSKTSLVLGLLASFCLSVVGVVNEEEDNLIHSGAAVIFFVTYQVNMAILTWYTPQIEKERKLSSIAYILRQLCVILAGLDLVIFAFLSTNWGKYKLYIAICEWSGTIFILIFNWTFAVDFTQYSVGEIETVSNKEKQKLLP